MTIEIGSLIAATGLLTGVMLTLAGLLWRQGADVRRSVDGLSARMDALAVTVGDIDRRLARVEGRIAGPPWVPPQAPEGHE